MNLLGNHCIVSRFYKRSCCSSLVIFFQIDDIIGRFNKSIEKGRTYHNVSVVCALKFVLNIVIKDQKIIIKKNYLSMFWYILYNLTENILIWLRQITLLQNRVPGQIEKLLTTYNTTTFPYYKPLLDQLSKLQTITDSKK